MKNGLKIAVATALLAIGSAPAFAVDNITTGDSSLFVTVYDPVLGASVVQDLDRNYSDFQESAVTPVTGLTLNYSVDMSVFASVGSNLNNIRYSVFAGDSTGGAAGTGALVTASPTLGTIPGINADVVGVIGTSGATGLLTAWQQFCGNGVTCTGTGFSSTYFGTVGVGTWGENMSALDVPASAELDTALGFYRISRSGATAGGPLVSDQYANANGVATWLLNSAGQLVYNAPGASVPEVPIPAAAWLLLSGLGGLGVFGRRKTTV